VVASFEQQSTAPLGSGSIRGLGNRRVEPRGRFSVRLVGLSLIDRHSASQARRETLQISMFFGWMNPVRGRQASQEGMNFECPVFTGIVETETFPFVMRYQYVNVA